MVPKVTMMDGTLSLAMKKALSAADPHRTQQRERDRDAVGQAQPVRQHVPRDVRRLAEIHGEDAGHRDHAADRHVEIARDQQERHADADDHDVPVVRQDVDDVLGLVEVRHEQTGDEKDDDEHAEHEQGDERLVAHPAARAGLLRGFRCFDAHASPFPGVTPPSAVTPLTACMIISLSMSQPLRIVSFMLPS